MKNGVERKITIAHLSLFLGPTFLEIELSAARVKWRTYSKHTTPTHKIPTPKFHHHTTTFSYLYKTPPQPSTSRPQSAAMACSSWHPTNGTHTQSPSSVPSAFLSLPPPHPPPHLSASPPRSALCSYACTACDIWRRRRRRRWCGK